MEYGLIGGRLGHSYSKPIHEALAGYDYRLCPLPTPEEAHAFMRARDFKAINVTIPYKELVMPYCDVIAFFQPNKTPANMTPKFCKTIGTGINPRPPTGTTITSASAT